MSLLNKHWENKKGSLQNTELFCPTNPPARGACMSEHTVDNFSCDNLLVFMALSHLLFGRNKFDHNSP